MIELVCIMGIIGVLSSIAIPSFTGFRGRVRKAEDVNFIRQMERQIMVTADTQTVFPKVMGGGFTYIYGPVNPPGPVLGVKRVWVKGVPTFDDYWRDIEGRPDGPCYNSYYVFGMMGPGLTSYFLMRSQGDLDNDSVIADHYRWWYSIGNEWQLLDEYTLPGPSAM